MIGTRAAFFWKLIVSIALLHVNGSSRKLFRLDKKLLCLDMSARLAMLSFHREQRPWVLKSDGCLDICGFCLDTCGLCLDSTAFCLDTVCSVLVNDFLLRRAPAFAPDPNLISLGEGVYGTPVLARLCC